MRLPLIYFIIMLLFLSTLADIFAQNPAEKIIVNYISKEAKKREAVEYAEARKIIYSDLDADGDKDAVVQYTLEGFGGGNNFAQMLAVFTNHKGVYIFAAEEGVGSKFSEETSTLKRVFRRNIYIETESCPEPPQGICENPKKGQMTVRFHNGKLIKIRGTLF